MLDAHPVGDFAQAVGVNRDPPQRIAAVVADALRAGGLRATTGFSAFDDLR